MNHPNRNYSKTLSTPHSGPALRVAPLLAAALLLEVRAAHAEVRYVRAAGNDNTDCSQPTLPCLTIAWAAGISVDGDVIDVGDGVFNEFDVVIDRSITVKGSGSDRTTIQAGKLGRHFEVHPSAGTCDAAPVVTLEGMTLLDGSRTAPGEDGGSVLIRSGSLTLDEVIVSNNEADDQGGAVACLEECTSVLVTDAVFENNSSGYGGAVYSKGDMVVRRSTFLTNHAEYMAGAIFADGLGSETGNLELWDTQITGNQSDGTGAVQIQYADGRIVRSSFVENTSTLGTGALGTSGSDNEVTLANTTFTGNTGEIVGAFSSSSGTAVISNCSFIDNEAYRAYSSYLHISASALEMNNTIVASPNNPFRYALDHCRVYPANPPMTGVNNLIDQPCQNAASGVYGGALSGGSLGTLDEHGGMTLVYSLDPSSNAVDAGLNRCPGPSGFRLPRDQRNVRRPQGAACDIGAFEVTQP